MNSDPQTHVTIAEITKIQLIIHSAHKHVQLNFWLLLWRSFLNITKFGNWHCSESCRHVVRNVTALNYSNADIVHNTIYSELFNSKGCNMASYYKLTVLQINCIKSTQSPLFKGGERHVLNYIAFRIKFQVNGFFSVCVNYKQQKISQTE